MHEFFNIADKILENLPELKKKLLCQFLKILNDGFNMADKIKKKPLCISLY